MGMRPATKLSLRRWDPSGCESKLLTKMLREIPSVKGDYAKHTQSRRKLERVVEADVTSLGRFVRKQRGLHLQVFGCAQRADDMSICLRVNAFTMDLAETRLRAVLPVETFDRAPRMQMARLHLLAEMQCPGAGYCSSLSHCATDSLCLRHFHVSRCTGVLQGRYCRGRNLPKYGVSQRDP